MMQKVNRITIRNAEEKDVVFCTKLEEQCFSEPWSCNAFRQSTDAQDTIFRIAEKDGRALGYYVAGNICNEINLYTIAVDPAFRQQGTGSALLEDLIRTAKREEAYFVGLEVRQSNQQAQKLYEKYGFVCNGKRPSFYRKPTEDALLYTLTIKEEIL